MKLDGFHAKYYRLDGKSTRVIGVEVKLNKTVCVFTPDQAREFTSQLLKATHTAEFQEARYNKLKTCTAVCKKCCAKIEPKYKFCFEHRNEYDIDSDLGPEHEYVNELEPD